VEAKLCEIVVSNNRVQKLRLKKNRKIVLFRTRYKANKVLYLIIFNNILYSNLIFYIRNIYKMTVSINLGTESYKIQGFQIMTLRKSL